MAIWTTWTPEPPGVVWAHNSHLGDASAPDAELQSHYFSATLPRQFDEWIWFERSKALTPIGEAHREVLEGMPETFPFGL